MADKSTISWYDQNAEGFGLDSLKWTPVDQIEEFAYLLVSKCKVLDAGCGAGRDTNELDKLGFNVVGIDASEKLVGVAQKFFPKIKFIKSELSDLPFEDKYFGGIWCHAVLLHLENEDQVRKALKEFSRVLVHEGIIHIFVKSRKDKPKTELVTSGFNHTGIRLFQYFSTDELQNLLVESGFKIKSIIEYEESDKPNGRRGVFWINVLANKI